MLTLGAEKINFFNSIDGPTRRQGVEFCQFVAASPKSPRVGNGTCAIARAYAAASRVRCSPWSFALYLYWP